MTAVSPPHAPVAAPRTPGASVAQPAPPSAHDMEDDVTSSPPEIKSAVCGGFDEVGAAAAGFAFDGRHVRLPTPGPALLTSALTIGGSSGVPAAGWRLRVRGSTAVEVGLVSAGDGPLPPTALHGGAPPAVGAASAVTLGSRLRHRLVLTQGCTLSIAADVSAGVAVVSVEHATGAAEPAWAAAAGGSGDGRGSTTPGPTTPAPARLSAVLRPYTGPPVVRLALPLPAAALSTDGPGVRLAATAWAGAVFEVLGVDDGGAAASLAPSTPPAAAARPARSSSPPPPPPPPSPVAVKRARRA